MSLLSLILVIALIGLVVYMIETYIPMPQPFKILIRVIVVVAIILWLLQLVGNVGPKIPSFR